MCSAYDLVQGRRAVIVGDLGPIKDGRHEEAKSYRAYDQLGYRLEACFSILTDLPGLSGGAKANVTLSVGDGDYSVVQIVEPGMDCPVCGHKIKEIRHG